MLILYVCECGTCVEILNIVLTFALIKIIIISTLIVFCTSSCVYVDSVRCPQDIDRLTICPCTPLGPLHVQRRLCRRTYTREHVPAHFRENGLVLNYRLHTIVANSMLDPVLPACKSTRHTTILHEEALRKCPYFTYEIC